MKKLKYLKNAYRGKTIEFKSHYSLNEFVSENENTFKFHFDDNSNHSQNLPDDINHRINEFYNHLIDFLNKYHFYPHLIETSLYKPESSRDLAQFYVTVICPDKDNLINYVEGIKNNISDHGEYDEFGPIIHNDSLDQSPFYFMNNEGFSCDPLSSKKPHQYCYGQYTYKDHTNRGYATFSKLSKQIEKFFEKTTHDFKSKNYTSLSSIQLNSALLVPLPKPSASFFAGGSQNYKGGGIFLFGELKDKSEKNRLEFILQLRQFIIDSVFGMTYSSVEMEEMEDSKNFFQLGVVHHFKNTLRVDIVEPIDSILKQELPDQVAMKLKNIKSATENTMKHTSNLVKNVKLLKSKKDFDYFTSSNLKKLLMTIRKSLISNDIDFHFQDNINDECGLHINKDILKMILEELVQNAVKAYASMEEMENIPVYEDDPDIGGAAETKKIEVEFSQVKNQVFISVLSYDTEIDVEAIKKAGSDPISNRKSGVGLYTLNKYLETLGAIKVEKLKYFRIENNKNPKGVKVSFSFQKITNHDQ